MDRVIQERLEAIGQTLETQVDDQISKFENMKVDDLQAIRDEIQKKTEGSDGVGETMEGYGTWHV